jgi:hypothetical protein
MSFGKRFFLHGAGKYNNWKFHALVRYAGWLQGMFICAG